MAPSAADAVIAIVALANFEVSLSEVAVMVTMPPGGTVAGAVYVGPEVMVGTVIVGLNDPQAFEPQVVVQITPASAGSLVTATEIPVAPLTCSELGTCESATVIGNGMIVMLTLLVCEGLLVTVAVIVTTFPIGTSEGAV
jgi:hypothetical protein